MKKIIILVMVFCLLISMGVYAHLGVYDDQGGHFVKSGNVCVAYHYFKGINAGYEIIFNEYCKWEDRETLKPFIPNDNNGTWKKYDKKYKVGLTEAKLKDQSELYWSYYVEVDGKSIVKNQFIDTKSIVYSIKVKGMKGNTIIYKGFCENQKLNENGLTEKIITCTSENEKYPPMDYIFNFKTCYDICFANCYIPLTPTPIPTITNIPDITNTPDVTLIPTDEPTISGNNGNVLPKTGESNNIVIPIIGLTITILGLVLGFGVLKIKQSK